MLFFWVYFLIGCWKLKIFWNFLFRFLIFQVLVQVFGGMCFWIMFFSVWWCMLLMMLEILFVVMNLMCCLKIVLCWLFIMLLYLRMFLWILKLCCLIFFCEVFSVLDIYGCWMVLFFFMLSVCMMLFRCFGVKICNRLFWIEMKNFDWFGLFW